MISFEFFKKIFHRGKSEYNIEQKISFIPSSQDVFDFVNPPISSKNLIPQWYKDISLDKPLDFDSQGKKMNLKMCMPFLDALTAGYVQETWAEIVFFKKEGKTEYKWAHKPEILSHRENTNIPVNDSYEKVEMVWKMPWIPKVPKGYSILITHPFNRFDLPFFTSSGIIDADDFFHIGLGQIPFYVKKNFEGYIPIGTPIYQMIPFKRNRWAKNILNYNESEQLKNEYIIRREFFGAYKKLFWKKKKFD